MKLLWCRQEKLCHMVHDLTWLCALQVLLEKGVMEGKILFLSLIAAPDGIHKICGTFPRVKLITSEIDAGIGDHFQVIPGRFLFLQALL